MIKPGHNGHYVTVLENGTIPDYDNLKDKEMPKTYDELVIAQESQITPVYGAQFLYLG